MKTRHFILALLSMLIFSCNKTVYPTAEVQYLHTANDVLTVRSVGYAPLSSNQDECVDAAQENAFKTLFYRGIPGSQQTSPLVTIDEKSKEANSGFLKDFFETKRYKTFITASSPVSKLMKQRGQKKITVDVGINLNALRKELEQNHEIRKFGY